MSTPMLTLEDGPELNTPLAELLGSNNPHEQPTRRGRLRAALTVRARRWHGRAGALASLVVQRWPDRFTLTQGVGASAAGTGIFLEWGTSVGLITVGLAVLGGSIAVELLRGH